MTIVRGSAVYAVMSRTFCIPWHCAVRLTPRMYCGILYIYAPI